MSFKALPAAKTSFGQYGKVPTLWMEAESKPFWQAVATVMQQPQPNGKPMLKNCVAPQLHHIVMHNA
jgi:hypothetical protein